MVYGSNLPTGRLGGILPQKLGGLASGNTGDSPEFSSFPQSPPLATKVRGKEGKKPPKAAWGRGEICLPWSFGESAGKWCQGLPFHAASRCWAAAAVWQKRPTNFAKCWGTLLTSLGRRIYIREGWHGCPRGARARLRARVACCCEGGRQKQPRGPKAPAWHFALVVLVALWGWKEV